MDAGIIKLISEKFKLIKPKKYEKNIFTIFAQNNSSINIADTENIDTELLLFCQKTILYSLL